MSVMTPSGTTFLSQSALSLQHGHVQSTGRPRMLLSFWAGGRQSKVLTGLDASSEHVQDPFGGVERTSTSVRLGPEGQPRLELM